MARTVWRSRAADVKRLMRGRPRPEARTGPRRGGAGNARNQRATIWMPLKPWRMLLPGFVIVKLLPVTFSNST